MNYRVRTVKVMSRFQVNDATNLTFDRIAGTWRPKLAIDGSKSKAYSSSGCDAP